ncbi:3-oxoacid CoA-transferase subunit B [Sporomusa acidovorans]|uniref:Butyrate--acetoacetate CoA-transferase subunit B n=1 Tax=Sporomusa acidovorans (strain ATCC 49682 / DSM 3132 / Mol) TaxID=1123286 RepID=A0ABZ3JA13_SPOA4|nr:3-oxoacid CoA-transferase subunit B [Sporomusa acidovorans]OZC16117.1 butyrate--acetoacetate CoA-transferase subunit B [Sporomusa acidovorans DSM 3132]SDD86248.1 acetate CoA/acetoacetate CoA-transferase beta subunit [Sporomusa acidovorans]
MDPKEMIARRAAKELSNGEIVNLGFGIPNAVANYVPEGVEVLLEAENGALVFGGAPKLGADDPDIGNAGGLPITMIPGSACFDLATSFCIIRGGHVNTTILGALEVDQEGNIANWATPVAPGKWSPGMGGAMDLVSGAKKVIATLIHTVKGNPKILKKCQLPLTGKGCVSKIITEKCVFEVTPQGLMLTELAEGVTVDELRSCTEAEFYVAPTVTHYQL